MSELTELEQKLHDRVTALEQKLVEHEQHIKNMIKTLADHGIKNHQTNQVMVGKA